MKWIQGFILLTSISYFSLSANAQTDQSIYRQVIGMYEQGVALDEFEDSKGAYIGRCYFYLYPKEASGALLVIDEKVTSDNGPGFPITKTRKATIMTEMGQADYYDDLPAIDRRLQEEIDKQIIYHNELEMFNTEWVSLSQSLNTIMYIRKNGNNIVTTEHYEDTSKMPEQELRQFKRLSYKRYHSSCYFFKKVGEQ